MKIYVKAKVDLHPAKYIGGKLSDLEGEPSLQRAMDICEYIYDFSPYYLVCLPDVALGYDRYEISGADPEMLEPDVGVSIISRAFETLPNKEDIDLIDHQSYLEVIAYNGVKQTRALLYPLSEDRFLNLRQLYYDTELIDDYVVQPKIDEDIQRLGVNDEHYILQGWD